MYKALVVDDHPFIRATVKMLLAQAGVEVVAEADNGAHAVQLARDHQPDLIVLDISMPRLDGMDVIARLRSLGLSSRILVLTSQAAEVYALRCQRAGASGYVCKTGELGELALGVKAVMGMGSYFPTLTTSTVQRSDHQVGEQALIDRLSNRELSVLQQLALGKSNKEIGVEMLLSAKTISTYKTRILEKLGMASVVDLAEFVKRARLF
jgi:two-component system response regulator EvgA